MPQREHEEKKEHKAKRSKKWHLKKRRKKREQAKKSRKRVVRRNKKYIETYKTDNPCPCGEKESCCLSFHHNNGKKSGNISDMVNRGYGIKRIQTEVDKCVVLCLNCHAKLHNKVVENKNL